MQSLLFTNIKTFTQNKNEEYYDIILMKVVFKRIKYSIGEKQLKVLIVKKIFDIYFYDVCIDVGLMVGWVVFMGYSYQRSYNEWKIQIQDQR